MLGSMLQNIIITGRRNGLRVAVNTLAKRGMAGRVCAGNDMPRCDEKKMEKSSCEWEGQTGTEKAFSSMWSNPECCNNPCPDFTPRFDDLYYKPSDKSKKKYARTWAECPEIKTIPKKVCAFEKISQPPIQKRARKTFTGSAVCQGTSDLLKCISAQPLGCPRFVLPGCRKVRNPPICKTTRGPADCKKKCTPYPSYSECMRDPIGKKRKVECTCLNLLNMCEVWAYWRAKVSRK